MKISKPLAAQLVLLFILAACLGDAMSILGESEGAEYITTDGDFEMIGPELDPDGISYIVPNKKWVGPVTMLVNMSDSTIGYGQVLNDLQWAIDTVNLYAEVDITLQGTTEIGLVDSYLAPRRNTILVGFQDTGDYSLGDSKFWYDWTASGWIDYSQIRINPNTTTPLCLKGVFLHELLHSLNIPHTSEFHSIMRSPTPDCIYMQTLRLHDIIELQERYPARPNRQGVITHYNTEEVCGYQPELIVDGQSYSVSACIPASGFGEVVIN